MFKTIRIRLGKLIDFEKKTDNKLKDFFGGGGSSINHLQRSATFGAMLCSKDNGGMFWEFHKKNTQKIKTMQQNEFKI